LLATCLTLMKSYPLPILSLSQGEGQTEKSKQSRVRSTHLNSKLTEMLFHIVINQPYELTSNILTFQGNRFLTIHEDRRRG
jgi:hypothetical protein